MHGALRREGHIRRRRQLRSVDEDAEAQRRQAQRPADVDRRLRRDILRHEGERRGLLQVRRQLGRQVRHCMAHGRGELPLRMALAGAPGRGEDVRRPLGVRAVHPVGGLPRPRQARGGHGVDVRTPPLPIRDRPAGVRLVVARRCRRGAAELRLPLLLRRHARRAAEGASDRKGSCQASVGNGDRRKDVSMRRDRPEGHRLHA